MDNITFRKRIEEYRKRSIEQKKYESKLNYQSRFGVKDDEVSTFNIKGIATDKKENKLVMAEDREDKQKFFYTPIKIMICIIWFCCKVEFIV
ncbi:hypothetical protein UM526_11130 [Staphylococcus aureus]|nr:hypothetical protein UM526_11130 [Staphylococcus aureus]